MDNTLYEQDFYAWANEQARLLRAGRLTDADIEHIAEEIESLGKTEKRELASRLKVLLTHLLMCGTINRPAGARHGKRQSACNAADWRAIWPTTRA
jgi:hypothetical protein